MIKWIADYLGTASHDSLGDQQGVRIIDVRDLVDKSGNLPATARQKMDEAVACLKRGEKIVVCCDYGISRSNSVAAGILSLYEGLPLNKAIRKVIEATGEKEIKIELLATVREALEEVHERRDVDLTQRRIFITGGSGFIGRALVGQLRGKHEVYAPPRADLDLARATVDLDLFVREHEIDSIVHLANPRIYNTNQAMGETVVSLKNILDVCRQNHIKLIYLSNWEVYSGYGASFLLASESLPPLPKGISGETKYLCEHLLEQHRRNYGLQSILLRSGSVYGGEGDRPKFIFNFLSKAACNEKIVAHRYLNGFPSLDLLHINDLTGALSALIDSDYAGTLHVGSGRGISTTQVANLIVKITGSSSEIEHCEIQDYAPNIVMDCARAKSVLGWQPRTSFEEGLRMLLAERFPQQTVTKENR